MISWWMAGVVGFVLTLPSPVEKGPVLDGHLESLWWTHGVEVTRLIQVKPDEGEPISEPTRVYLLTTQEALYVAFEALTPHRRPQAYLGRWDRVEGDVVGVYLDPFGDGQNAYVFEVNAAGIQGDAVLSDGGSRRDNSWDGVWFAAAAVHDSGYTVEIRIPYSAFRHGTPPWGVNLYRWIPTRGGEESYLVPYRWEEGLQIRSFARLKGIPVGAGGSRGLEVYPVLPLRGPTVARILDTLSPGVDLNWGYRGNAMLQLTLNPDFAEVEADPFRINLSKFDLYFPERRPFFVEGAEIFRRPRLEDVELNVGFTTFYSRRVGQVLIPYGPYAQVIPQRVRAGLKWTQRSTGWDAGMLVAVGDPVTSEVLGGDTVPRTWIGTERFRWNVGGGRLGLQHAFRTAGDTTVQLLAVDYYVRRGPFQWMEQVVRGESNQGEHTLAHTGGVAYLSRNRPLSFWAGYRWLDTTAVFLHRTLSFLPQASYGERSFELMAGPVRVWPGRTVQYLSAGVGVTYLKELREAAMAPAGVTADSRSLKAALRLRFRNGWGMGWWGLYGRWYEAGSRFPGWMTGFHLSSDWSRTVAFWSSTTLLHDYNYARQVLGITGQVMGGLRWQANNHTALYAEAFLTREWDGAWRRLYTTLILRPSLSVTLKKGLDLRVYANPYGASPYTRSEWRGREVYTWREARWIQNRYGVFLSWNVRPKSWVYVTLQQTQTWDEDQDRWHQEGGMALKVRWLFLF